ncbi:MAG: DNA polymerase [Puniceicoccaceae bacterium]|nr:MAG: DNA polymerase [Puniceicoccaceae bacterium]
MALRYLFIDFDSFFASVEQQHDPGLRGRPVGVVPSLGVETTCCIAASYEAKAFGVKTGTSVREARQLCPGIRFVAGNHRLYVQVHQAIHRCIHEVIYVDAVLSIDEMYGRLPPHWQAPAIARAKALEIKRALAEKIGPHTRASIGIAPNRFLAKLASKMEKPDGLVALDLQDLPEALYRLRLEEITGIGDGMQRRLHNARIFDMEALCQAERHQLHRIWGSVEGDRMWHQLRGIEVPSPETQRRSIGHSHVLPPSLRTFHGAHATLHRMLHKACRRLRALDYFAVELSLQVKFGFETRWGLAARCFPTQDNVCLAQMLNQLWQQHPIDAERPTKVAVTLAQLVHANSHTPSLFTVDDDRRRAALQQAMDRVNRQYGGRSLYYAEAMEAQRSSEAAPMRISFTHIPDLELENE